MRSIMYLVGLFVLIPLGTAGIKTNISNFGADQFDCSTSEGREVQERFFSWFYVSINIGAALSYGFLTTFASVGGLGVPKEYGYFTVYCVAAVMVFFSVMLFFAAFSSAMGSTKIPVSCTLITSWECASSTAAMSNTESSCSLCAFDTTFFLTRAVTAVFGTIWTPGNRQVITPFNTTRCFVGKQDRIERLCSSWSSCCCTIHTLLRQSLLLTR